MKQPQTPIILKVILTRGLVILLAAILSLMPSLPVPEKAQAVGPPRLPTADGANGNLPLTFRTGQVHESAPVTWQEMGEKTTPVNAPPRRLDEWKREPAARTHDLHHLSVMGPTLTWNTFVGSANADGSFSMAADGYGNVYVAGYSGASWGTPVNPHAGTDDAFAAKFDSSGRLQWHTFLGSADRDFGYAIAIDGYGNVYVAGTSDDTWGTPVNPHAGGSDAFVAKLNSSGLLEWHTFLGSALADRGNGVAVDGDGNIYVGGYSESTWGAPLNAQAGQHDAFVAKLNSSGVRQWHTFLGSADSDVGSAIAADGTGNVYIAGDSYSTWGSPVNPHAGGSRDAFAAKVNSSGMQVWHTFLGSAGWDEGYAIAVDESENVYVAGGSDATWGAPVNPHAGGWDVFAVKLNSTGVQVWHTFLGSANWDESHAIAVDESGDVYLAGTSYDAWGLPVNPYSGGADAFVAKLNSSGVRQWHTFLGSANTDMGSAIAVNGSRSVYLTGYSYDTWGAPINPYAGSTDAFVAKIQAFASYLPIVLK
jgi:hypothetical protein